MVKNILTEDFQILAESNLPFGKYKNKTFLITGATGLIGSLIIKNLLYCNRLYQLNIRVLAIVRNCKKAEKIFANELSEKELVLIKQDLSCPLQPLNEKINYIVHAAADTVSKNMVTYPADNMRTALVGTMSMLELAKEKHVEGMVYISSMEVYGTINVTDHKIEEWELGYVNLSDARSCYPEGKRACECLCSSYVAQNGINVCTARLAQTFGAGILPNENRVFAQFAKSVLENKDIILHTAGLSEGNYVYTADAIKAILLLLTEGKKGEVYNVSNEECHMRIRDMAELVAVQVAHGKIKVVYDIPEEKNMFGYAPDVKMHMSNKKIKMLGWEPQISLLEAYRRMIGYMKRECTDDLED